MSKCHIVGNHMWRLNYESQTVYMLSIFRRSVSDLAGNGDKVVILFCDFECSSVGLTFINFPLQNDCFSSVETVPLAMLASVNRGSYRSAHALLNLLYKRGKR